MIIRNKILVLVVFFTLIISCKKENEFKELEFNDFNIEVPISWEQKSHNGIDFRADFLMTKSGDTIHIDYGNQNGFFDEVVQVFSKDQIRKYDSLNLDTKKLVYSKTPSIDESQGVFLKEYYYYDTINGFRAKIKIPKKSGKGIIGISIDSINTKGKNLKIYATNINQKISNEFIKSIKSIKIKNP